MVVSKETLDELAITYAEYEVIVQRLGREPNNLELGMFGSLWSEHCGYKHSKPLLKILQSGNDRILIGAGQENAGAIDIGDGLAVVMKIESHNHPSSVEPYQGAATGVGGIVRDIFAMGARPIALLNSLRFGPLSVRRNRQLFRGVVAGISDYGNCIGIPNIGGEISFAASYSGNPIVNAMCVGVVKKDRIMSCTAGAPGNLLLLVGAETGRDGIHGASGLASRAFEEDRELRQAVQVGNPFLEKILMEACVEVADKGCAVGIQDLGAAGLSSSTVESAARGGMGVEIEVSDVRRRDANMSPYEVMLSESQERMLIVVKPGETTDVYSILEKWGLEWSVIGEVTADRSVSIFEFGDPKGQIPIDILTDPPKYRLEGVQSDEIRKRQTFNMASIPLANASPGEALLRLLASPSIASKKPVYQQYDHQVQTNTINGPGTDSAVLRIKGTGKGIALATDGNGKYSYLDPFVGGEIAVSEACRNIVCSGAHPIALTDCLNFGDPEKPEVYYQLEQCIRGIAEASKAFEAPIVSGNVSLYNETYGDGIYPTPIIGALGILEDVGKAIGSGFIRSGDLVILLGDSAVEGHASTLAGSEYLEMEYGMVVGQPSIDLSLESRVQKVCLRLIDAEILSSAHDCSDGGLAVALAECCINGGMGIETTFPVVGRWDAALFGEAQSRIIVSLHPRHLPILERNCTLVQVPIVRLGQVTGDKLNINGQLSLTLQEIRHVWESGLENALVD